MELIDLITDFVATPYPLWNNELANKLIVNKRKTFTRAYSLTACISKDSSAKEKAVPLSDSISSILIVLPSQELNSFLDNHGLESLPFDDFEDGINQIKQALNVFQQIPSLEIFINHIVHSIYLLKAESPETDISYSHPDVPFSIFVSVPNQPSSLSALRVAESILHESMHLLLTLIEEVLPLINQGSKETYYSPWRDEERPVRGVLHGLFVFKAIMQFYKIAKKLETNNHIYEFAHDRVRTIKQELQILSKFQYSLGLTLQGKALVLNMLTEEFSHLK